jgi:hypothetical protein
MSSHSPTFPDYREPKNLNLHQHTKHVYMQTTVVRVIAILAKIRPRFYQRSAISASVTLNHVPSLSTWGTDHFSTCWTHHFGPTSLPPLGLSPVHERVKSDEVRDASRDFWASSRHQDQHPGTDYVSPPCYEKQSIFRLPRGECGHWYRSGPEACVFGPRLCRSTSEMCTHDRRLIPAGDRVDH